MPLGSKDFKTAEDFKDPNKFYRVVSGSPAYEDILESGKIRTLGSPTYKGENAHLDKHPSLYERIKVRSTDWPSFKKGKANLYYSQGSPDHYVIETEEKLIRATRGRHGKGSTHFPVDAKGLDVDEAKTKIYKHVGEGKYKKVRSTKKGLGATAASFAFAPMVDMMIDTAMQGSKAGPELMKELEANLDPLIKRRIEEEKAKRQALVNSEK